ncbi:SpvB/TcaC N-terminal domain-containing protein [Chitinophagaceae bacterium MMS25-I14]
MSTINNTDPGAGSSGAQHQHSHPLDQYSVQPKQDGGGEQSPYYKSQMPEISLPKGGGALKGIDEKFSVNAINGTAGLQVGFPLTPGRGGFTPSLGVSYSSGGGNSEFGLGWGMSLPAIQRRTDKQLPQYKDELESDVFLLAGAEDLVPLYNDDGSIAAEDVTDNGSVYHVKRYRPRIEGLFARIELISKADSTHKWWRVTTKDNICTWYGLTAAACISDPSDETHIYKWLPQLSIDNKGNAQEYEYIAEDVVGVTNSVQEKNRISGLAPFTNKYLKSIRYCNKRPYFVVGTDFYNTFLLSGNSPYAPVMPGDLPAHNMPGPDYLMEAVLDYGDHTDNTDGSISYTPNASGWPCRKDPFSDFHAGFEIRTYRRCKRVLMFHNFRELGDGINLSPVIVSSLDFVYAGDNTTDVLMEADYITSVIHTGYKKKPAGGMYRKSLPAMTMTYQTTNWNSVVQKISSDDLSGAPQGLTGSYQWTDLYGEGISGILTEQAGGWYYKSNLGDGHFTAAKQVAEKPSLNGLGTVLQWADLDADGRRQLVCHDPVQGYFELDDDQDWQPFKTFERIVNVDWSSSFTKMLDLDGDGRPDLLVTDDRVWTWYKNEGTKGMTEGGFRASAFDEEKGPRLVLNDPIQSIFLADMNGDGMTDIVRIKNGEVCYWPNMGYGRFGAKVTMKNAPRFAPQDIYNPQYLYLADVSGTGAADILYMDQDGTTAWTNLAGNGWSEGKTIAVTPGANPYSKIAVLDLLGNGTGCIVWSSPLPQDSSTPLRYVDLMGGYKPYLMRSYNNGMGKTVTLNYKSSTKYYLEDKAAGTPWATRLPFPVQCLSEVVTCDIVSKSSYKQGYSYHHGYYDHAEREFRGFGRVDTTDTDKAAFYSKDSSGAVIKNDLDQYPVFTKTWYHTGAWMKETSLLERFEREYYPVSGWQLPDTGFEWLQQPTVQEQREAHRALKGCVLRQEIYALDGDLQKQGIPYSVAQNCYHVKEEQPVGNNRYGVFFSRQRESMSWSSERNVTDPRISHSMTLAVDRFGNVLEAAAVVYPRQDSTVNSNLPVVQQEQGRMHISYTISTMATCAPAYNLLTDYIDMRGHYRLYMPCETKSYEVTGLAVPVAGFWTMDVLAAAIHTATEIDYAATPAGGSTSEKRLLGCNRIQYRFGDMLYPIGAYGIDGLEYRAYSLAFTDNVLAAGFPGSTTGSTIITPDMLAEAGYKRSAAIAGFPVSDFSSWIWLPGGYAGYDNPVACFLQPTRYYNAYDVYAGGLQYWGDYLYLPQSSWDTMYNTTSVQRYNWATLQPEQVTDANNNITEACYDALGMVAAVAIKGKGTQGDYLLDTAGNDLDPDSTADTVLQAAFLADPQTNAKKLLGRATWRCVYDLTQQPAAVAMIAREEHYTVNPDSNVVLRFTYSDGFGRVAMHKAQSAYDSSNTLLSSLAPWIGSGKTVYNNKGNVVLQYEPYYSTTHSYDAARQAAATGVSPRMYYDPLGRVYRTDMPDGSYSKTTWDSWQQTVYDANDTVGTWINSQLVNTSGWYDMHHATVAAAEAQDAAEKAATHAGTPTVVHLDNLGRGFYTIQQYRQKDPLISNDDPFYRSYATLDIAGNRLSVTDGLGRTQLQYCYSPLKAPLWQQSIDGGTAQVLLNVAGQPCYSWDAQERCFHVTYDVLLRPEVKTVTESGQTTILERTVYGETINIPDGRGRVARRYHTSGLDYVTGYDFKGLPLLSLTQLLTDRTGVADWKTTETSVLDTEMYGVTVMADALGRPKTQQTDIYSSVDDPLSPNRVWDGNFARAIVRVKDDNGTTVHVYDKAGALYSVQVQNLQGQTKNIVNAITYDSKGQRQAIWYGNGTKTGYTYDPQTFRLTRLLTVDLNPSPNVILQDLNYWYDPVGNITTIQDNAQQTVFFNNTVVTPDQLFTYDALYRLTKAEGREHTGIATFGTQDNYNDNAWTNIVHKGDGTAIQRYTQQYSYDAAGNILTLQHIAGTGSYTRMFSYANSDNRLQHTEVGGQTYNYSYDAHGNMTQMPHLGSMVWNQINELSKITRGTTVTCYQYNGGQRVRKYTDNGSIKEERIYLGNYEIYRKFDSSSLTLERTTLHISDDSGRVAMIETRTVGTDTSPQQLQRFVYSNHLGSASLELDETARIISYEEYHPYGTTSYQAMNATINAVAKRYRYTGKERDEESGLYYHGARYYIPWLGRWSAVDPLEAKYSSFSSYNYCLNNPIGCIDTDGRDVFVFWQVTTFAPSKQSGLDNFQQNTPTTITTSGISVIPKAGKDTFFYDKITQHGSWERTQFFPNEPAVPFSGSGITQSESGLLPFVKFDDNDFTTLAKIAPPELVRYLEKHDYSKYGGLKLQQAGLKVGDILQTAGNVMLMAEGGIGLLKLSAEAAAVETAEVVAGESGGFGDYTPYFDGVPAETGNTLRGQATSNTCVPTSLDMVLRDFGIEMPSYELEGALNHDRNGALVRDIPKAIQELGVDLNAEYKAMSISEMQEALNSGNRVIGSVNDGRGGHAVVIDAISDGSVTVRDPLPVGQGSVYSVPIEVFSRANTGTVVISGR